MALDFLEATARPIWRRQHIDLSVGKSFGEYFRVRFIGTNLTDTRYMLDTSNTFGGSHFADPRMYSVQVKYDFHY